MGTVDAQSPKVGITAGLNVAGLTETGQDAGNYNVYRGGLHIGLVVDFAVNPNVSVIPELLYSQQGGGLSLTGTEGELQSLFLIDYVKLPVNLAYKFKIGNSSKLFVFAGPYVSYGIAAKLKTDVKYSTGEKESDNQDVKFGSAGDQLKALDYGANLGAGVQLGKGFFKLQYNLGMANLSNGDTTLKNKNIALSFGYFF